MPRTTTRASKPVESFGPEVLQALIEGSKREIVLELPYRKAAFFRQRVNALRAEMRKQNHQLYPVVSQATIRVIWGEEAGFPPTQERRSSTNVRFPADKNTKVKLIIAPADSEFAEALKRAGVEVKPFSPDLVSNTEKSDGVTSILETYLKEPPAQVK
jgi:hypothetical protein